MLASWKREPRLGTVKGIALAAVTWPAAMAIGWALWPPVELAPGATPLTLALQLCAAPSVLIGLQVVSCFRLVDTDQAQDPIGGGESRGWKINQRVLQNTVEQALLFLPPFVALSTRLDAEQARALPLLMTSWCAGRVLFWVGYRIRVSYRALGFDWTLWTAALTLGALGWTYLG